MCSYIEFKAVETFLAPVTALTYCSSVLNSLVSGYIMVTWMGSDAPHPQQLTLPGFQPRVGVLQRWFSWILTSLKRLFEVITTDRVLNRIFWTLFVVSTCGATTLMMSTLSWIIYTHVLCSLLD